MTLTQQFLIVSIFPLSFLLMVGYLWQTRSKRRSVVWYWSLTLLTAALWASSILRLYGGVTFTVPLVFTWGIIGHYAFTLTAIGVLLTTGSHLSIPHNRRILAVTISLGLWLAAVALDPTIWRYRLVDLSLVNQSIRHFDLWAAVWVASWFIPVLAAWLLTQQVNVNLPNSLYRNQVHYWLLVLNLFFIGGVLASIQQPGEPAWQEAALFLIIPAAFIGTISIVRSRLPDLQLIIRHILSRLSGTLIIFGVSWVALAFLTQALGNVPNDASRNLILALAAALFTGLFTLVYRWVNQFTQRLFLPMLARRGIVTSDYANAVGNLPDPVQLGQLFLRMVQANLAVDDGWFFTAADGPGGRLVLRPLASLGDGHPQTADFAGDSPFALYLRENSSPLAQHDVDLLEAFATMEATEKQRLQGWGRHLYLPLRAGDSLVGVVALGARHASETYDRGDFALLQSLATQISPLLAQAQNLASLRRINDYVFQQNRVLARDKQYLQALTELYAQFVGLISADLRRPFLDIGKQVHRLQQELAETGAHHSLSDLGQQITDLKHPIDRLITTAGRIQVRRSFNFQVVHLEEVAQNAIRNLRMMADARRVRVEFDSVPLPGIYGDEQQLLEAIQNILHNAIKFNKIGGTINVDCGIQGSELCVRIRDTGVGMPPERLEQVWEGFAGLISGKNGSKGAGLGLTLARFIILAHGGRVEAQSKYGSGSVFSVFLPLVFEE